ncbi:MAG: VPA1262 family N-terminal domain-containing protein [Polyangiaceae bacterium]
MSLDTIAQDYPRAEITCAWVHERPPGSGPERHVLVFAVAELCPEEQPVSPNVGTAQHRQLRMAIEPNVLTLYVRRDFVTPAQALAFFRGSNGQHTIPGGVPPIECAGELVTLTADEEPVLMASNLGEKAGVGAVLPQRPTAIAILSKLDVAAAMRTRLGSNLTRVVQELREAVAVDLSRFPEHLGSLHLCFANPLLRRMERSVTSDERTLLVRCYERENLSVIGCEIELTNEWPPVGNGFRLTHTIQSPFFALPMPTQPHLLRVRLFDRAGRCIENDSGVFLREFVLDVELATPRQITYVSPGGEKETYEVQAVSYDPSRARGPRSRTPLQHVDEAVKSRELDDLAAARVFLFFPGGDAARREALGVVRELVGGARERCDIVDPYLAANDILAVVPFVRDQRCPVRLLSSREFLHKRGSDGATHEFRLATAVESLRAQLRIPITAKQMGGRDRSPVHDRVLVVDKSVYLLGSSLSEYGSRATTLFHVPDPRHLLAEIDLWWTNAAPLDSTPNERTTRTELRRLGEQLQAAATTARRVFVLAGRALRDDANRWTR